MTSKGWTHPEQVSRKRIKKTAQAVFLWVGFSFLSAGSGGVPDHLPYTNPDLPGGENFYVIDNRILLNKFAQDVAFFNYFAK
jgi:hypothetical protein